MALTNEEMMLKDRIRHLLTFKRMSIAKLSPNPTLQVRYGRQINGAASVPFTTLYMLLYMFPDISAEWLILGEGPMNRSGECAPKYYTINHNNNNHDNGIVNIGADVSVNDQIAELRRQLEDVTADRDMLKGLLRAMTPNN